MMKRLLAVILALTMCLTLLPMTAFAENTATENKLFLRRGMQNSEGKFVDSTHDPLYTYSLPYDYQATVIFYYGTEDNAQMVHMDDLVLSNLRLVARPVDQLATEDLSGCVVRLYAGEVGTGTVTHTPSGATFTVDIRPDIQLFEGTDFKANALNSLQFKETDSTVSGVLKATDGWQILGTEATSSLPAHDFVTVTPVDGQEYAAISVDLTHDAFAPGNYEFILRVSGTPYGSETSEIKQVPFELTIEESYSAEDNTEEEEASLWLCTLRRNSEDLYALSTDPDDYFQDTRMRLGSRQRVAALYGTEAQIAAGTAMLVAPKDLELPDNLSFELIAQNNVENSVNGYAFWLYANGADENGYIFYKDSGVRIRVSFNISVYASTDFNGGGTTYDYTGEEPTPFTLYLKAEDGWDICDVGGGFPPCFEIECPEDQEYAIVTVNVEHQTFAFDQTYSIGVTVKNQDGAKLSADARVRINDARPGISTQFYTSLDFTEIAVGDGYPGDERVAYYKWRDVGEVSSFTADLWAQKENYVLENADLSDEATINTLESYGFTLDIQSNYIKVNTTVGRDKRLTLVTHGDQGSEAAFYDVGLIWNDWGCGDAAPQIEIDGVEYTFGLAEISEETDTLSILSPGDGFGGWDPWLGAVSNYGETDEEPAPAAVYDAISNVNFEIVDFYNTTGPASPCNVSLEATREGTWNGCKLYGVVIDDDSPDGAEVKLKTTFTVGGEEYSIINVISHGPADLASYFVLDAGSLDTAEELNTLLSSKSEFLNWVQEQDQKNGTSIYHDYQTAYALGIAETVTFGLKLPAATYDDIITVDTRGLDLILKGRKDDAGNRTTMPGLRILRNRYPVYVENIDFVADPNITHTYKDERFTCGVLAARADDINASAAGDARIDNCSFFGFDYGVRSTDDGCATLNGPCQFFSCGVGYLLDCANKYGGNGSEGMDSCLFANCGAAVRILNLNNGTSAYLWRIYDCDFLSNETDLDIQARGRFYLYRNYFGMVNPNQTPDQWDAWSFRSRTALLRGGNSTQIITNPCRVNPCNVGGMNDDTLYIDTTPGLLTYIPNSESPGLKVDATSLIESEQTVTIHVTDENEDIQATWTIN